MDVPFGVRVRPPGKQTDGLLPGCEPAGTPVLLVVVSLDDYSLVCLLPWWKEQARFPLLLDPDRVSWPHRPASKHTGIDTHVDLVVPGRGAQNPGISGQVSLKQRRHHTAGARAGDRQAHCIADGERVANPGVLHEVLHTIGSLHDDVG